jgi:hypothetical protein
MGQLIPITMEEFSLLHKWKNTAINFPNTLAGRLSNRFLVDTKSDIRRRTWKDYRQTGEEENGSNSKD